MVLSSFDNKTVCTLKYAPLPQYKLNAEFINKLEKFEELERIRYTTSHPRDMTDDLIDCYSSSKKLMPFVHLPIQSGSNKILYLMNRKQKQ